MLLCAFSDCAASFARSYACAMARINFSFVLSGTKSSYDPTVRSNSSRSTSGTRRGGFMACVSGACFTLGSAHANDIDCWVSSIATMNVGDALSRLVGLLDVRTCPPESVTAHCIGPRSGKLLANFKAPLTTGLSPSASFSTSYRAGFLLAFFLSFGGRCHETFAPKVPLRI